MKTVSDAQDVTNESDVEQKIVLPLLSSEPGLGVPLVHIKSKQYIRPLDIGKGRNRRLGFVPDYLVWANSLPAMVVEVKPPRIKAEVAYEEAQQYAYALNSRYPTGVNPVEFVVGINGSQLLIGNWDAPPRLRFNVASLAQGDASQELYNFCGWRVLEEHAARVTAKMIRPNYFRPYSFAGGQAILRRNVPLNNFALELAPILKRYFSSEARIDNDEILTKGYVSSEETTKYDALLETFLRDSLQERHDQWGLNLNPTSREEAKLTGKLGQFTQTNSPDGHLQLIIGGVGSGKSIFTRRYQRHLMPASLRNRTKWAFIDFNDWSGDDKNIERWVCDQFLATFEAQNPEFEIYDADNFEKIFAPLLAKRERTLYVRLKSVAPVEYEIERSRDIRTWTDDRAVFVENLCRYFISDCGEVLVSIFDNVDRLSRDEQIRIFSVAQWFKSLTKSFCVLQLRDETYELYKNEKPLDTYRTAVRFYIRPPRFVDVIKKRVWLAHDYITANLADTLSYRTEDGKRITYKSADLANFLTKLYQEIFHTQRNAARIVESLAGRDTRKSLETFSRIVTSGHLSELSITSIAKGAGGVPLTESDLLCILMRTDYKLFGEATGPISNVFFAESDWARPTILLGLEILNFLIEKRRVVGELGVQGYFTVRHVQDDMENLGFSRSDVLLCVHHLLDRELLVADELKVKAVHEDLSIKVHASGFMHQRILCERLEYLYGILTVVPFRDRQRCEKIAQTIQIELNSRIGHNRKVSAVQLFREQLAEDIEHHVKSFSVSRNELRGAEYTLERVDAALKKAMDPNFRPSKVELL
ncbi:MAG: hypothetical protein AABZ02_08715 [Bacteroidota bacterium]